MTRLGEASPAAHPVGAVAVDRAFSALRILSFAPRGQAGRGVSPRGWLHGLRQAFDLFLTSPTWGRRLKRPLRRSLPSRNGLAWDP
jgi:hypothetical protein